MTRSSTAHLPAGDESVDRVGSFESAYEDYGYPELLRLTPDPPGLLYGVGDPSALSPGLAIIGARRATPYGIGVARTMAAWCASAGFPVISGGAMGCDQAAHAAALDAGGVTIAVLAGGADVPYPAGARELFSRISVEGAVVSEQPWGTRPKPWMFRRRNRIIAGLSVAVLVVEAGLPSGTFSTADDALAAGRDVLAVPGSIHSESSRGCNRLIRDGATPITDPSDLRDALYATLGPPATEFSTWPSQPIRDDPLVEALCANPSRPEDVARDLGMDVVAVLRSIGRYEAVGVLRRYRDGRYGPGG
jgi:DNA processing protein